MNNILQINSSIYNGKGESSKLATEFVAQLRVGKPEAKVVVRELAKDPIPHLDEARFAAFLAKPGARTPEQARVVGESDALIDELKAADAIVIALPMYNFGVPSQFKAWVDHVARAGVTFKYTDKGPVGLLTGKKAWVFATRGGLYAGTAADSQTAYVRQFLAFVGITEVEFVYAEGLAMGEAPRNLGIARARQDLLRLAA
ncbi:MAG: FMN-dependent NADH-azoreductase [Betaproteobacteria bacterium]